MWWRRFGNVLQTAQTVSALDNIGCLDRIDAKRAVEALIGSQRDDGSWPELLAFGDQTLEVGTFGQIGHGSEAATSAFCIEALERLTKGTGLSTSRVRGRRAGWEGSMRAGTRPSDAVAPRRHDGDALDNGRRFSKPSDWSTSRAMAVNFDIVDAIADVETIARGHGIRED